MGRKIVAILGAIAVVAGVFDIVRPQLTLAAAQAVTKSDYMSAMGLLAIFIGLALALAGLRHEVRIPLFVTIVGGVAIIFGAMFFVHPQTIRRLLDTLWFDRGDTLRNVITVTRGIVRVIVGVLLLYSALVPPQEAELAVPIRRTRTDENEDSAQE